MKIVLIQPPIQDFYDTVERLQPLGLAYLKAVLVQLPAIQVAIRDYHHGHGRTSIPLPEELTYLRPYYNRHDTSPFSTFNQYYHFGADYESIADDIADLNPDIVGISSLCSPYYREALYVARIVKEVTDCPVIVGGCHPSACPEMVLSDENVDFIILGEGEEPVVKFVSQYTGKRDYHAVPGLGFKKDGEMIINPPAEGLEIDDIPFPDFSDFDPNLYTLRGQPVAFMMTSRSCPYKCSYCSVHHVFGNKYRMRSPDNIIEEMKIRYDQGYRIFDFEDDNFTACSGRVIKLCDRICDTFNSDITLTAMNGVCYQGLDYDVLVAMYKAGFRTLNLALVSSDDESRRHVRRSHSLDKFIEIVTIASQIGYRITAYQILGLPYEDLATMIDTMVTLAGLPVLMGASIFYLTPNTELANDFPSMNEHDIFRSRLTAMAIETENFSRDDIYTLFIATRIINFLKREKTYDHPRADIGRELLDRLMKEQILHGKNKEGLFPIEHFKPETFFMLWNRIDHIESID